MFRANPFARLGPAYEAPALQPAVVADLQGGKAHPLLEPLRQSPSSTHGKAGEPTEPKCRQNHHPAPGRDGFPAFHRVSFPSRHSPIPTAAFRGASRPMANRLGAHARPPAPVEHRTKGDGHGLTTGRATLRA